MTKRATGTARFEIDDASAGVRTIEAQVSSQGLPVATLKVARYRAPGPPKPGRVGRLRAKRSRGTVTVSWPRLRGADGFVVRVKGSDGRRAVYFPTARQHRAKIQRVGRSTRLDVRVFAWKGGTRIVGRVRTLKIRAAR